MIYFSCPDSQPEREKKRLFFQILSEGIKERWANIPLAYPLLKRDLKRKSTKDKEVFTHFHPVNLVDYSTNSVRRYVKTLQKFKQILGNKQITIIEVQNRWRKFRHADKKGRWEEMEGWWNAIFLSSPPPNTRQFHTVIKVDSIWVILINANQPVKKRNQYTRFRSNCKLVTKSEDLS